MARASSLHGFELGNWGCSLRLSEAGPDQVLRRHCSKWNTWRNFNVKRLSSLGIVATRYIMIILRGTLWHSFRFLINSCLELLQLSSHFDISNLHNVGSRCPPHRLHSFWGLQRGLSAIRNQILYKNVLENMRDPGARLLARHSTYLRLVLDRQLHYLP